LLEKKSLKKEKKNVTDTGASNTASKVLLFVGAWLNRLAFIKPSLPPCDKSRMRLKGTALQE
jgi:hypothetical protein